MGCHAQTGIDNDIHNVLMSFIRFVDKTLHKPQVTQYARTVLIGIVAASIQNITWYGAHAQSPCNSSFNSDFNFTSI